MQKWNETASLTAGNLSMGSLLDFNFSDVTKCWPVFLNLLQFKIFTLTFFQKVAEKPLIFEFFKGPSFHTSRRKNANLGVLWEIM